MYKRIEDFCFSLIHGQVFYQYYGEDIEYDSVRRSPILYDELSGERVYVKRLRYYYDDVSAKDLEIHQHYIKLIKNPPNSSWILWPKDLIEMNEETEINATDFLVHNYRIYDTDVDRDPSKYGLVFSGYGFDRMHNLSDIISEMRKRRAEDKGLSYHNPRVINLIRGILFRLKELNDAGYIYYDLDFSRFFVDEKDNVYLDFSNLLFHASEEIDIKNGRIHLEEPREVSLDFIEPWVYKQDAEIQSKNVFQAFTTNQSEDAPHADMHSQNYGICAMIFYLMIGRYAYEGDLMHVISDDSLEAHFNITQERVMSPIFIFDPLDSSNSIGTLASEEIYIERWKELPKEVQTVFVKTLCRKNAEREIEKENIYAINPTHWIDLINKYFQ